MSESASRPPRVLVVAFQGWSDAGDATTEVLQHLAALLDAEVLHEISAEGYVDFQVHRPKVVFDGQGNRLLEWPDTKLYGQIERPGAAAADASAPAAAESGAETVRRIDGSPVTDLFLLAGVEPARDWQNFADEIVELVDVWAIDSVIILGAMYSDAPHSRPIVTSISSESPELREATGAERSSYEGAIGISTVLELALVDAGIPPVSLWAQVPHYVHSTPSPKATLALLDKLEELLDIVIPRGELLVQANEWEANINRIAAGDEEMSSYIRRLEESRDEALAAETTGDAIALEFEKFLEGGRAQEHRRAATQPPVRPAPDGATTADGGVDGGADPDGTRTADGTGTDGGAGSADAPEEPPEDER
ncbi:PAC2 family protein [Leucobacter allii]|uniref:proteasome assembly chaperone family protein n=1 Tax=Leucobacter allii TaxID=2932247 RepID=UPI001FD2D1F4|nr:PAC2 family protein [Leucobacter allii]UOR03023.1 PAC2 family protein [Leucobacter allii]